MGLEHAILVSLAEKRASGYELARRFDASIGHFWPATHQQIYRVLARMESDTWVESDLVVQAGRPDKKVYAITAEGRDALREWLARPSPREPIRSEFAVRLRGQHHGDRADLLADVTARRAGHAERLAAYRESEARFYPDPTRLADDQLGGWLTLRGGIRTEEGGLAWCDEILRTLAQSER